MSLRGTSKHYTICEVLRELNDLHQGLSAHEKIVRKKLALAEDMAKRMSSKLKEYNEDIFKNWWEQNKDYKQDLERRLKEKYVVEKI